MLAVQSIEAAKLYYEELQRQQAELPEAKRLKVATILALRLTKNSQLMARFKMKS